MHTPGYDDTPPRGVDDVFVRRVASAYPRTKIPGGFDKNCLDYEVLEKRIIFHLQESVKSDASPGFPLMRLADTNEKLLANHQALVVQAVLERLELYSHPETLEFVMTAPCEHIVANHLADLVRLFVKSEPHPKTKINDGRFRLIASVSLIDQLIERLLFSTQNRAEIQSYQDIPSQPGMGFSEDSMHGLGERLGKLTTGSLQKRGIDFSKIASGDISGFDWSLYPWELILDIRVRLELMGAEPSSLMWRLCMVRGYILTKAVFVTSQGRILSLLSPGIQLSGSYNTSSTNSRIRYALALLVGARWALTMGDDCVEEYVPEAPDRYLELGHPLKFYETFDNHIEFCSHRYEISNVRRVTGSRDLSGMHTEDQCCMHAQQSCEPFNTFVGYPSVGKLTYNMLHQNVPFSMLVSLYEQFEWELRHHPDHDDILRCVSDAYIAFPPPGQPGKSSHAISKEEEHQEGQSDNQSH